MVKLSVECPMLRYPGDRMIRKANGYVHEDGKLLETYKNIDIPFELGNNENIIHLYVLNEINKKKGVKSFEFQIIESNENAVEIDLTCKRSDGSTFKKTIVSLLP
jgi:hypothetical protein